MDELRNEMKEKIIERLRWEDGDEVQRMLQLSSLEIMKQKYLSCPDDVVESLADEIREAAEKAA